MVFIICRSYERWARKRKGRLILSRITKQLSRVYQRNSKLQVGVEEAEGVAEAEAEGVAEAEVEGVAEEAEDTLKTDNNSNNGDV